jgi:phosphatidylserine/phosphatidylglycerophosphate/cardiolipin synthase-like enzyme
VQDYIPSASGGAYPLREGHSVRPLLDGPEAFTRIAEAVANAEHSVWMTLAFHEAEFRFPGDHGSLFDLLGAAADRGVDVRGLFWREPDLEALVSDSQIFAGTPEEQEMLRARDWQGKIRWDVLPGFCHHQKSWLIDAGKSTERAFVGGINLDRGSLSPRGHQVREVTETGVADLYAEIHDLYLEIIGPATTDVFHNFTQRWNQASERKKPDGSFPDMATASDLAPPTKLAARRGHVDVQITRTVMAGIYQGSDNTPEAPPFDIAAGESSVREQVLSAVAAARRSIYIENQIFLSKGLLGALEQALRRGVHVIAVVPRIPMKELIEFRRRAPEVAAPIFDRLEQCGQHPNFTLAGLAQRDARGRQIDIYVHAKMMLVDDQWATIGSTNFMGRSFFQETEMNASFWCPETVTRMRNDLFEEHLGQSVQHLGELEAFERFAAQARENASRFAAANPLEGLAHALLTRTYCT